MSNIIKAKYTFDGGDAFIPDRTIFRDADKYIKAISYPQLVRNINSTSSINTTNIKMNTNSIVLPEGYYLFGDIISLLSSEAAKLSLDVSFQVLGPNSYRITNSSGFPYVISGSPAFGVLMGWPSSSLTVATSGASPVYNMNVSLGADVIEISVIGLNNTFVVPIAGEYLSKLVFYPVNNTKFCEKNQAFREMSMRVDYVAIGAAEELKPKSISRIVFAVE